MPFYKWWFGAERQRLMHTNSFEELAEIANETDFSCSGVGITVVKGSVGHKVRLHVIGESTLIIEGNIGSSCSILKEGSGDVTIAGSVTHDLKLIIRDTGSVNFLRRPPDSVIHTIQQDSDTAEVTIAGTVCGSPEWACIRHSSGVQCAANTMAPKLVVYEPLAKDIKILVKMREKCKSSEDAFEMVDEPPRMRL